MEHGENVAMNLENFMKSRVKFSDWIGNIYDWIDFFSVENSLKDWNEI